MMLAVTFSTTKFSLLKKTWEIFDNEQKNLTPVTLNSGDEAYTGGVVLILDWSTKTIKKKKHIPWASGIIQTKANLCLCAYNKLLILNLDLEIVKTIKDNRFNNLHSICLYENGYAIAASGIDTILYTDNEFKVIDHWCAVDFGFNTTPLGQKRFIDLEINHQNTYYPLMLHTTHLNSLLWNESGSEMYVTFFHQGSVFAIQSSGKAYKIIDNLNSPHSLTRLADESYIVSDSRNNRVLICHKNKILSTINMPNCNWIQDAKPTSRNTLLVCDANNCRILETNFEGKVIDSWCYDKDWKIYEAILLSL